MAGRDSRKKMISKFLLSKSAILCIPYMGVEHQGGFGQARILLTQQVFFRRFLH